MTNQKMKKINENTWFIVFIIFTILAMIFGGCRNKISDMNGVDTVNIVVSKSTDAILIKHQYVITNELQIEYLLFEQDFVDFKAFDNFERGDTIK